jgi:type IV secretion system protein VirD4
MTQSPSIPPKPKASISNQPIQANPYDLVDIVTATLDELNFEKPRLTEKANKITARYFDVKDYGGGKQKRRTYVMNMKWRPDTTNAEHELDDVWESDDDYLLQYLFTFSVAEKDHPHSTIQKSTELVTELRKKLKQAAAEQLELNALPKTPPPGPTAKFATVQHLKTKGFITQNAPCDPAPTESTRFYLGRHKDYRVSVPEKLTYAHTIVCGITGTGKSVSVLGPNIYERPGASMIITEAIGGEKQEPVLFKNTAGFRQQAGHQIYYFSTTDPRSLRFNPIDTVKNRDDASKLANLIVKNTTEKHHAGEQIWVQTETTLLTALILYAAGLRGGSSKSKEGDNANLAHIRQLLRGGPQAIISAVSASPVPEARAEMRSFLNNTSPNFRFGVLSGLIARLNLWSTPHIAALTEVSDFDLDKIKNQLFTFYLSTDAKQPQLAPVAALILNTLFNWAGDEKLQHPLAMILDEFTNYGYIPNFATNISIVRNTPIAVTLAFQDYAQLEETYGKNDATKLFGQPNTKIFLRAGSPEMAQRVSGLLGHTTKDTGGWSTAGHKTTHYTRMPLLDSSVVNMIPNHKAVVTLGGSHPVKVSLPHPDEYQQQASFPPSYPPKRQINNDLYAECEKQQQPPPFEHIAEQQANDFDPDEAKAWQESHIPKPASKPPQPPKTQPAKPPQQAPKQELKPPTKPQPLPLEQELDPWEKEYGPLNDVKTAPIPQPKTELEEPDHWSQSY